MKRGLNLIITCLILLFIGQELNAQFYRNQGYWKKDRWYILGGVGASNFLGELGGRDQIGSDFIWDLETKEFKPALSIGIRYVTSSKTSIRGHFSYAKIGGDDALTREPFRFNRNLHFESKLYEVSAIFEYQIFNIRPGHRYNLAGVKGQKPRKANIYGFIGVAGIHFNPKGKLGDTWYELQPLGTEGQNIEEEPYSLYSIAIPLGIGYRWRVVNNDWMVGIEIGHRITFTDYMDDVSTVYYDETELMNQRGLSPQDNLLAAYFADPSLGYYIDENGEQVNLNSTFTGAQRGDPDDNDAYLFVQATVSYQLGKRPYRRKRFGPKKGKRIVF
ncbi:MAG: hypothetical protein HKN79_08745 [Flavobacteriales bacterium]|nr:hypothetical protein [Flavobacteriales bacterium]